MTKLRTRDFAIQILSNDSNEKGYAVTGFNC